MNQFTSPFGDNYNMEIYGALSRRLNVVELCGASDNFRLTANTKAAEEKKVNGKGG